MAKLSNADRIVLAKYKAKRKVSQKKKTIKQRCRLRLRKSVAKVSQTVATLFESPGCRHRLHLRISVASVAGISFPNILL
jgi:hypothetical protein